MNTQKINQYTPALGGFFSWLGKAVRNVTNAVAQVSHNPLFILSILEDAFDGDGFNVGYYHTGPIGTGPNVPSFNAFDRFMIAQQDVVLSETDEAKLDIWVELRFIPFFKSYFAQIKAFNENGVNLQTFINYYNNAQEFISLLTWYQSNYQQQTGSGFSNEALVARNQFITIQINLLKAEIAEYMRTTAVTMTPQQITKTFATSKYITLGFNLPATITASKNELSNAPVNIAHEELPTVVVPDVPNMGTDQSPENKSLSGAGLLFWSLVAVGLVYQFTKPHEESEKGTAEEKQVPKKALGRKSK